MFVHRLAKTVSQILAFFFNRITYAVRKFLKIIFYFFSAMRRKDVLIPA